MRFFPVVLILTFVVCPAFTTGSACAEEGPMSAGSAVLVEQTSFPWMKESTARLEKDLVAKYGEGQRSRISRGLHQVTEYWRPSDGDAAVFEDFVRTQFAGDQATLDIMFNRYEQLLEQYFGHIHEIQREFAQQSDLDRGPIMPFDSIFSGYDPKAHFIDDSFDNKLAFVVLLNFPLTTLQERLTEGPKWSRRQWAEVRLTQLFSSRIPAEAQLATARAFSEADAYIAGYNIRMYHLLDQNGRRLFPPGLRLLSHWNLRDEIKADYADKDQGLAKQRMIQQVMERIVTQTIPQVVIDNPHVDWNPFTNEVKPAAEKDTDTPAPAGMKISNAPEPDKRYAILLNMYKAQTKIDPWVPAAPTYIARKFDEEREIPEQRVHAMLDRMLSSPLFAKVAALIQTRLGRPLEPFDIWYDGFRPRGAYTEAQLDAIVSKRYPTPEAYRKDIPNILAHFSFTPEKARYLADNIIVDPARGSGHAMGAMMRGEKPHLRTRVGETGMNYKGFNIAVHEMGHNIEQIFSLNEVDHTLLSGVPNTAFTEALAFVLQARDLEVLGLAKPEPGSDSLKTLNDFWNTCEIAAVALVDMDVWHWMYQHPNATPAQLRDATVAISKNVWNRYFAQAFNRKDVVLPGIYSHMINSGLYLPDYPIGHMIAFQVEEQMEKAGAIGPEFERVAKMGKVTPDLWMINATGKPVGPEAMLAATERALAEIGKR